MWFYKLIHSHRFSDRLLGVTSTDKRSSDVQYEVVLRFTQHGQRYTTQRRAIVIVLANSDRPLTIPQMLKRTIGTKGSLAQSSLYRNLAVLENVGVVQRVFSTDDVARYELNDHILGHHHHMVCSKCGDIRDVRIPESLETNLDSALTTLAKRSGFRLDQHRLDLIGRCSKCA